MGDIKILEASCYGYDDKKKNSFKRAVKNWANRQRVAVSWKFFDEYYSLAAQVILYTPYTDEFVKKAQLSLTRFGTKYSS